MPRAAIVGIDQEIQKFPAECYINTNNSTCLDCFPISFYHFWEHISQMPFNAVMIRFKVTKNEIIHGVEVETSQIHTSQKINQTYLVSNPLKRKHTLFVNFKFNNKTKIKFPNIMPGCKIYIAIYPEASNEPKIQTIKE